MKVKIGYLCAIGWLVCICAMWLTGCNRIVTDDYTLYTYDTQQNRFVNMQTHLQLDVDAGTFELTYFDTIHMMGTSQKTTSGYLLQCDNDVYVQVENALSRLIGDDAPFDEQSTATWRQAVVAQQQVFHYGDYLFSSSNVDLIRRVRLGDNKTSYTSIDGYYESASNTDSVYLLKDGKVYTTQQNDNGEYQKDTNGEPLLYDTPDAIYTLANGLIILTQVNEKGEVLFDAGKPVCLVYLMATITYPADLDKMVYTDDQYSEITKELAQQLKGKSVGVLTKTFYSTRAIDAIDFN